MRSNPGTMETIENTQADFADAAPLDDCAPVCAPEPPDAATRAVSPALYSAIRELTSDNFPPGLATAVFETIREQQDQIAARDAELAATREELAAAKHELEERLARIEGSLRR